jgi:hypothetical protein
MARRDLRDPIVELDHGLIVARHEVDLAPPATPHFWYRGNASLIWASMPVQ